jgi:tetratricopeptide (TPR) repeat protein
MARILPDIAPPVALLAAVALAGACAREPGAGGPGVQPRVGTEPAADSPASAPGANPASAPGSGTAAADPRVASIHAAFRAGDFAGAEARCREWVAAANADPRAAFYLGLALHKQKRYGEALPELEAAERAAADAFPERPHVPHYLGWCRLYLGDLAGAKVAFVEHARTFPDYDDTQFALGVIAYDEDRVADAERQFRRALALLDSQRGPPRERAKCLARLGDCALRRDDVAGAERDYRAALALWPDHHEAWAKLARVLDRTERADEAAAARARQQAILDAAAKPSGGAAR